jgi:hypothetical protein
MVLVSSFAGKATVRRFAGSRDGLEKTALAMAEKTGFSTLAGETVYLDKGYIPVFKSIGRVLVGKADPLSLEAFQKWARKLANELGEIAEPDVDRMVVTSLEALLSLDVNSTPEQISRAVSTMEAAISSPSNRVLNLQAQEITKQMTPVVNSTSAAVARMPELQATLGANFALPDSQAVELLSQHHSFWVRNRQGQLADQMSARARNITSRGLEQGLGRAEIARDLEQGIRGGLQQPGYWRTVAANHVSRARSFSLGSTMRSAGIQFYRIEAVLDDRTTHQCNFLHGKILPVGPAATRMDRSIADPNPEGILWNNPFIRDNGESIDVHYPDGTSRRVANITQRSTGIGPRGPTATFSGGMSQADMVDAAIGFPPYHHGCRTTVVPA